MTQAEFVRRVVAMEDTLYRVSTTILPQLCDRQDAVQSAIEKALRKWDKLRDPAALEAWLTRILINECYLILRSPTRFVLLDEPFSQVAPLHVSALKRLILQERASKGILLTDHMHRHVTDLADRLYVMADGRTYLAQGEEDLVRYGYLTHL